MASRGQPRKFKNAKELQKCLDKYREYLEESGKPPTIAGLAYYTGINRQTIYNYEKDEQYFGTIKKFRDWVIMTYEETAVEKGNAGVIFLLKNYGYTDRQELQHDGQMGVTIIDDIK